MATQTTPRKGSKTETRQVHDQKIAQSGKAKRPAPAPTATQKPVYTDWAMI